MNGLFALGGALVGAIVSGIFAIYVARKNREKNQLTLLGTKPTQLIAIGDEINDEVKITVSGAEVTSLYMMDFKLLNSGNVPLEDIEVPFIVETNGKTISANFFDANHHLDDPNSIVELVGDNRVVVKSAFLNPNEQLSARALFSHKPEGWSSEYRKIGTEVVKRDDFEGTVPDVILRSFYEAISRNLIMDAYFKLLLPQYREFKKSKSKEEVNE
ncbi:hypothetical protein AVL57_06900 [Alteromonas stellipolaris]|uniref:DUF4230 domain-containing protein n=2 Tax=Alteromonas TaxID=226 RepID=A0ABN4LIG8_9ALTE|nr:hypothetical protein AVL57_06900 [Alteromonas stellipolaris]